MYGEMKNSGMSPRKHMASKGLSKASYKGSYKSNIKVGKFKPIKMAMTKKP